MIYDIAGYDVFGQVSKAAYENNLATQYLFNTNGLLTMIRCGNKIVGPPQGILPPGVEEVEELGFQKHQGDFTFRGKVGITT